MKFLPFPALVLLLLCVALAGLAAFAASPLLYSVEKDQAGTVFHKNPEVLRQAAANSTTDMVPLMQDVIDGQEPIAVDIRLRDLPAGQHDLAAYALRYASLRGTAFSLDLAGGEIGAFLTGTSLQKTILAELMNQTAAFDAIQKVARRPENSNNTEVQAAVASQSAALKTSIRALSDRYSVSHAGVMDTSTKLSLDTTEYQKAEAEIQRLVAEIAAAELPEADPAYLEETRITLMIDPEEVTYRQSVQMFGVVSPPGVKRTVSLRLDNLPVMSLSTDVQGNYFTSYTVERIRAGEHTIAAGSGSRAPAEKTLRVTRVGSVTTLAAEPGLSGTETGAICSGTVMANYPVRNAPVTILSDGSSRTDTTTYEDGTFEVFVPLSPGNHTLRAEFSSDEYPISPSLSGAVTLEVLPAPVSFGLPETSSWDPAVLYGAIALILLLAGGAMFWFFRRRKRAPRTSTGEFREPAEAVRIRKNLEEIVSASEKTVFPAGSVQEAALHDTVSTLLTRYFDCLIEHGLSEAARQAYLDLAGRVATRLRLPAFRTLTPREMSRAASTERYAGIFARFVGIYEQIRYAGRKSEQDRFEAELPHADTVVGGDRH